MEERTLGAEDKVVEMDTSNKEKFKSKSSKPKTLGHYEKTKSTNIRNRGRRNPGQSTKHIQQETFTTRLVYKTGPVSSAAPKKHTLSSRIDRHCLWVKGWWRKTFQRNGPKKHTLEAIFMREEKDCKPNRERHYKLIQGKKSTKRILQL